LILLRSIAFNVFFVAATAVLAGIATLARLRNPERVLWHAVRWARVILWGHRVICRTRVQVVGAERLPTGAALIASAHQSAFDTVVWLTLVPRCSYVVKQELLRIPLFGGLLRPAGMIPVDRALGPATIRILLREAERAARQARQIVIFPQGTRVPPDRTVPLLPGIVALARRTSLPVIPVATDSGRYWGRRAFRKLPGTIHIVIRPPIASDLPRDELLARLAEAIRLDP
jgi:1-acyl-sn-glycerol-3-phosphate acyltransferase